MIGRGGAARKQKRGKDAAAALFVTANFPLEYEGPRNPEELWKVKEFRFASLVRVQQARIVRTRPIFKEWGATVYFELNTDLVNQADAELWMQIAGYEVGLMDWRPKFGKFEIVE